MRIRSKSRIERTIITAVTTVGLVVLLFPTIANWFSSLGFEEQRGSYNEASSELTPEQRDAILQSARDYNAALPVGPLRDPYMLDDDGSLVDLRADAGAYANQLNFDDGLMGWIEIPTIHTTLPIYHGTEDDTLDKGAGHLHGSALPVGGKSSHSVITAHSGRANASLFTDLEQLKIGDVFYTEVVGERFYYTVDQIDIVDPVYSGEKLRQVEGKDYVTLLTCTPTGVNSHRLLVRGARTDGPQAEQKLTELTAEDYVADFPWWIPLTIGVPCLVWFFLRHTDRSRKKQVPQAEAPNSRAGARPLGITTHSSSVHTPERGSLS